MSHYLLNFCLGMSKNSQAKSNSTNNPSHSLFNANKKRPLASSSSTGSSSGSHSSHLASSTNQVSQLMSQFHLLNQHHHNHNHSQHAALKQASSDPVASMQANKGQHNRQMPQNFPASYMNDGYNSESDDDDDEDGRYIFI